MCAGAGLALPAGISLLSAGVQTSQQLAAQRASYAKDVQQNEIARMQADYEGQAKANSAVLAYEALRNRDIEVTDAATQEKGEIASAADKRRALQRVATSYNGGSAAMLDRLEGQVGGNEAQALAAVEANKQAQLRDNESTRQATFLNSQVAPTYLTKVEEPDYGMTMLSGLLSGVSGVYSAKNRYK